MSCACQHGIPMKSAQSLAFINHCLCSLCTSIKDERRRHSRSTHRYSTVICASLLVVLVLLDGRISKSLAFCDTVLLLRWKSQNYRTKSETKVLHSSQLWTVLQLKLSAKSTFVLAVSDAGKNQVSLFWKPVGQYSISVFVAFVKF